MSANLELEAGRWVKATLEAYDDADHKAYLDFIPLNAGLPNYRYQVQRRNDVRVIAQHIIMANYWFLVVATAQGETLETGPSGLITMSENIITALHRANGVTAKARILACTKLETYGNSENVGSDVVRHQGAIFEVLVQSLDAQSDA